MPTARKRLDTSGWIRTQPPFLPPALYERMKRMAEKQDRSVQSYMRLAFEEKLRADERAEKRRARSE